MNIDFYLEKINNNQFDFDINDFLQNINKDNSQKYISELKSIHNYYQSLINDFINKNTEVFNLNVNYDLYDQYVEIINKLNNLLNLEKFNDLTFIKKRISYLRKQLRVWEYEYYVLEKPTVDDTTYDLTLKELNSLEAKYPEFITKSSPTKTVAGAVDNKFKKIPHTILMLSLSNVFNQNELIHFDEVIKKTLNINHDIEYNVEPKLDGLSISLIYQHGNLVMGLTRGNGKVGEDVTQNIKMINTIPQHINNDFERFEVRGEIFLDFKQFELINSQINDEKDKFANPRNAASGTLRRLNPQLVKQRNLKMIAYYIPNPNDLNKLGIKKQSEVIDKLKEYGFTTAKEIKFCKNINDVFNHIQFLEANQDKLVYPIDGAVIKENDIGLYNQIGNTSKFPHWATAYKFVAKETTTKILSISTNVGRTGKITYVAKLQPVQLSGSIISSATLNNAEYILNKDIRIGDEVVIFKAAEIIPYVKEAIKQKRMANSVKFTPAEYCPMCHSKLEKNEGEVDQYCINTSCPARVLNSIIHFCSKGAMNIEGLSDKTIGKFYQANYLKNIEDIYKLNNHRQEIILNIFNGKFKVFNKIIEAINQSKSNSLERLIFGLGIRDVGIVLATKLAKHYKNIDNLAKATREELLNLNDVGEVVSISIYDWFHNQRNIELINNLKQLGLNMEYHSTFDSNSSNINSEYYQKSFCITGSFDIPRDKIKELLIQKFDAQITSSVNKSTNYLIVGENGGSKEQKARELGIKIIYNKIWE